MLYETYPETPTFFQISLFLPSLLQMNVLPAGPKQWCQTTRLVKKYTPVINARFSQGYIEFVPAS